MTVEERPDHHIAHLTGLRKSTLYDHRAYAKNDIVPIRANYRSQRLAGRHRPVDAGHDQQGCVGQDHREQTWLLVLGAQRCRPGRAHLGQPGSRSALAGERAGRDTTCLTHDEFAKLLAAVTEPWRPLVEFLVASGCRWGEATALRPSDVYCEAGTVRNHTGHERTYGVTGGRTNSFGALAMPSRRRLEPGFQCRGWAGSRGRRRGSD